MKFTITNAQRPSKLRGRVHLQGSKNAMLTNLCVPLLASGPCTISNAPRIGDIQTNLRVLESLGVSVSWLAKNTVRIDARTLARASVDARIARRTTGSKFLIPIMTWRFGSFVTGPSGGDQIGDRGFVRYAQSLQDFGIAHTLAEDGTYHFRLSGTWSDEVSLAFPSFGLTVNAILCAASARRPVRILNACLEPEIDNTIDMLRNIGVGIAREGTSISVSTFAQSEGMHFRNMSDRNAAVTYACVAAATRSELAIDNVDDIKMDAFYSVLSAIGIAYRTLGHTLIIEPGTAPYRSLRIRASLFPSFHSDWQPLIGPLLALADGESYIEELLFPDRLRYWEDLGLMGAHYEYDLAAPSRFVDDVPHAVRVFGNTEFAGANVRARDIRGGAALLIAAIVARGTTVIDSAETIARGYERLPEILRSLGVPIRVSQ